MLAAAGVAAGLYGFWILAQARHSLASATALVARESSFPYRTIALDRPLPAGFEPISSAAGHSDPVLFNERLYVCGPAGLFAFDRDGALAAQYRPGLELPPSPLVRMASAGGSLWIASATEGLIVFDGRSLRQIRAEDAGARQLTTVLPLATGRILLGSEKRGVLVWDGRTLGPLHPELSNQHITALAGTDADLWAGTVADGVYRWHAGQLDHAAEAGGLPDPRVLSLAIAGTSTYVGTPLGVAEFVDGRFARKLAEGVFANSLRVQAGVLAVTTLDEGTVAVPLKAGTRTARVAETAQDRSAALLTDHNISALRMDRAGKLWVGYFDRGLDILDPGLTHKTHYEDDHLFCINRIAFDEDLTAVATANGLVLFDAGGKPGRVLGKADGLIANHVTDVLLDARRRSMIVATPAGLTMLEPSGASSLYAFQGLVNNHAYALAASGSRLLVGTLGGLSVLYRGLVTASYTTSNSGLKHNWVTALEAVDDGWFIGTYGAGVLRLDSAGRWSSFPDLERGLVVNPNALTTARDAVYAGTLGAGVAVYSRSSGRWARVTGGLPSLNVTALATGGGYLYIGTDNGLVRIPESQVPRQ